MSVGSEAAHHYVGGQNCAQLSSSRGKATRRHFNRQACALLIHERVTITTRPYRGVYSPLPRVIRARLPSALPNRACLSLEMLLLLLPVGSHRWSFSRSLPQNWNEGSAFHRTACSQDHCAAQGPPATMESRSTVGPPSKMTPLAPREHQIVDLISRGWTDKGIAVELGVTVRTIRTHLERLYRKRRLHSRAQAVALWIHGGM